MMKGLDECTVFITNIRESPGGAISADVSISLTASTSYYMSVTRSGVYKNQDKTLDVDKIKKDIEEEIDNEGIGFFFDL